MNTYGAPPPLVQMPVKLSTWETMQKHKPQSNSIVGGVLLFGAGSMHVAYTVWRPLVASLPIDQNVGLYILVLGSFHLAALVGGFIGAFVLQRLPKTTIYYLCTAFMIPGNLLFIIWPDQLWAILVGRLVVGAAHGIVYVPLVAHASENAVAEMRGRVLAVIGSMQAASMVVFLAINLSQPGYQTSINNDMLLGILSLIWVALGLILTPFFTYESVVYMLQTGRSTADVATTMCRLRNESAVTWSVQNDLEELQRQLQQESKLNGDIWRHGNLRPLWMCVGLRALSVLSNNVLLNTVQLVFVQSVGAFGATTVGPLVLAACRMVGTLVPTFLVDLWGRKKLTMQAGIGAATMVLLAVLYTVLYLRGMIFLIVLHALVHFQFGWGVDIVPHVVAGEAFALRKKPSSLAMTAAAEHAMHLVAIVLGYVLPGTVATFYVVLYLSAALLLVLSVWLYYVMPETRAMTLAQCRDEYAAGKGGAYRDGVTTYSRENGSGQQGITYNGMGA